MRIIASAVVTSALLVVGCGGGELPTETDATPETHYGNQLSVPMYFSSSLGEEQV
ncbi:hypothetical protein CYFUS_007608 [Cystobacter fuscus]|uniref:Lipoprotein n=1 Tax=Cystobacter fuscus TaxID=43 RepID=A0A250JFE7_9BACT|nr:hypothetical protein CYFUS_007608 [Cystobacter fuscus]